MNHVTFNFNGIINGYPSWAGAYELSELTILWNGTYWVMYGWPYDGEPRNYNNTLNPTDGWALYNNTTLTATFSVVLGACPIPTPSPTTTPSKTPTPSPTPNRSPSPTPTPSPSSGCNPPVLNSVILTGRTATSYTFGLFFTSTSTCSDVTYEYSCDGINWTSCGYDDCGAGFGCNSPVQVTIDAVDGCITCSGTWYFRLTQCCLYSLSNYLQSGYSNIIEFIPVSTSPSPTPSITKTPSVTPSITITPSITPSITVSPSITPTVTPSSSPGTCRYIKAIQASVETESTYFTIQYTKCDRTLGTFTVYLPQGNNTTYIGDLNICALYNTPLTVITGPQITITPVYGGPCSSPPPTPPKLCKLIKSINTRLKANGNLATIQYTNCSGVLTTFSIEIPYGNNTIDISYLNICVQVDTPLTVISGLGAVLSVVYGNTCASSPASTTLVELPFGFTMNDACSGTNTNFWCLDNPNLCLATTLYLSDGTSCSSIVTDAIWLANGENVRYWNGSSFSGCSLCV
jgi:hypothetical protein